MYHIVYLSTNLINGKRYIGDHSADNINDNYFGSGVLIKKAIKKYRKENFKKEILEWFSTKEEAFNAQEKYIIQYNTLIPNGYNISLKGGHQVRNSLNEETINRLKRRIISEETREKIRKSWIKRKIEKPTSKETKEKMSLSRIGKNNSFYGKHHSEETKKKLKNADKKYTQTEKYKENMSKSTAGNKNGMFSRHHSAEAREKIKKSWKERKLKNENNE